MKQKRRSGPGKKADRPNTRSEFGLTRKTFARLSGLSERTLATWEAGGELSESARRSLTATGRLLRELAAVMRKPAIASWLDAPNDGFQGLKPVEVVERGETDRVWRMIYFLGTGTAS
jgi:hypothetical protein